MSRLYTLTGFNSSFFRREICESSTTSSPTRTIKGNPRLNSTPWIPDLPVKFGFRIPIVNGIPDSYSYMPDSKGHDSGLHKEIFLRSRIPHVKRSRIPSQGVIPHLVTERSVITRLIATPTTIMS